MPITLDHVVFEVRDPEATAAFYSDLVGLEIVRQEEFRKGEAPFLSSRITKDTILDFFPPKMWANPQQAQNPNHFCLTMSQDEVGKLRERLSSLKIPIVSESERNYGARGWGVALYIADPDGIGVEFRYYKG